MNVQEYIQSGAIESYVLGLSSAEERVELDSLRLQHPELEAAIRDFEISLEQFAQANAVKVPSAMKDTLFAQLGIDNTSTNNNTTNSVSTATTPMVPVAKAAPVRSLFRYVAIAAMLLLVASAVMNFYYYSKYKDLERDHANLVAQRNTLYADNGVQQTKLVEMEKQMGMMSDSSMMKVSLAGVQGKENNTATVYWNKNTKEVYVMPSKLAPAPANMQYQLWALVDGQPVDAGVISGDCINMCKVKNIPNAQAFAITLEQTGGSPTPHLEQLFVMGKVS